MLSSTDRRRIDEAAGYFMDNRHLFESFAQSLMAYFENSPELGEFIHFIKYRIKDKGSLRTKLERILTSAGDQDLVDRITDFAGGPNHSFAHGPVVVHTSARKGYSGRTEM